MKEARGQELFVAIRKSYLNRQDWEEGMKMLGREGDWDQIEKFVFVESTMEEIPHVLIEKLAAHKENQHGKFLFGLSYNGRRYHGGFLALFDVYGREVGEIICLDNTTEAEMATWSFMLAMTMVHMAIGVTMLTFFYIFLGGVQKSLATAHNDLETANKRLGNETSKLAKTNEELHNQIAARTKASEALEKSVGDLQRFNSLAVGREMRMIELKGEVDEMARKAGVDPPYDLTFGVAEKEGYDHV